MSFIAPLSSSLTRAGHASGPNAIDWSALGRYFSR
jgi:hypothetical protein